MSCTVSPDALLAAIRSAAVLVKAGTHMTPNSFWSRSINSTFWSSILFERAIQNATKS